jgi:hypothetical protein
VAGEQVVLDPENLVECAEDGGFGLVVEIGVLNYGAEEDVDYIGCPEKLWVGSCTDR